MIEVFADLHIHSCLSPCADIMMLPNSIAEKLISQNIQIASITDHNSILNLDSFRKVFEKYKILLVPGIEIQTIEEVHILGYFDSMDNIESFYESFCKHISKIDNNEEVMGFQLIVNENDEYIKKFKKALSLSSDLRLEETVAMIKSYKGLAVAAHIDKTFGVINQLGILPEGLFDAVEVYSTKNKIDGYTNLSSSDAHYLKDLGSAKMKFLIEDINPKEVMSAILSKNGRKVELVE